MQSCGTSFRTWTYGVEFRRVALLFSGFMGVQHGARALLVAGNENGTGHDNGNGRSTDR